MFKPNYADVIKEVEKQFGISNSEMSPEIWRSCLMSTGLATLDLQLGGGLSPGRWYTFSGQESTGKSTKVMHILKSAVNFDVPLIAYFDYEGSLSPTYMESMYTDSKLTMKEIFGVRDDNTGKWLVEPKVKVYQDMNTGETFFDSMATLMRAYPDLIYEDQKWWYVYENTNANRKLVEDNYDKKKFTQHNCFYCEAPNGKAQAIIFLDSYPAMLPDNMDVDDPKNKMAAAARMFAENIPKIASKLMRKRIIIVGVNQLREVPMSMGCFYATSKVLTDKGQIDISTIVNQKLKVNVFSYNVAEDRFEYKPVVNWYKNGEVDGVGENRFLKLKIRTDKLVNTMMVTPNHMVLRHGSKTFEPVKNFKVGDQLITYAKNHPIVATIMEIGTKEPKLVNGKKSTTYTTKYDIEVEGNSTYLVGNCVVHNSPWKESGGNALKFASSARFENASRVGGSDKWQNLTDHEGGMHTEESVELEGAKDKYRYIQLKNTKNKISAPYIKTWERLWISNARKEGMGFCPVYDSFQYLIYTGQAEGKMKKFDLKLGDLEIKALTWYDFKRLILSKGEELKAVCVSLGLTSNPKIREKIFEQIKTGDGKSMFNTWLITNNPED